MLLLRRSIRHFIIKLFIALGSVLHAENFETSNLNFGCELSLGSGSFRNIAGVSMESCSHACLSRQKCKAFQYYRRAHLCMLLGVDSTGLYMSRNAKYTTSEKRFWTKQTLAQVCEGCLENEVCEPELNLCETKECKLISEQCNGTFHGNLMRTGSNILCDRQCYTINSGTMAASSFQYCCMSDGHWDLTQSGDTCHPTYESFINFMDCYRDRWDRVLSHPASGLDNMTIEKCAVYCYQSSYTYFGIEKGRECYCGNSITDHGLSNGCTFPCEGDTSLLCGGHCKSLKMCSRCETDSTKFNCCEGCNDEDCCEMGGDNCKAAPRCCYCPLVHVCYGCHHCRLCCYKPENLTEERLVKHVELERDDKCFGDSHKMGAICLPCTMLCCILGLPGCALTYVGSFCCCTMGCCCKGIKCCKQCCKKDNTVTEQPQSTSQTPQTPGEQNTN